MERWWRAEVRGHAQTGRNRREIKEEEWAAWGRGRETGGKVCKQAVGADKGGICLASWPSKFE